MRPLRHQNEWTVALLLLCVAATTTSTIQYEATAATATTTPTSTITKSSSSSDLNNYNCPKDCECNIAQNTHIPLLHAKCSSLQGLLSSPQEPTTYPLHSIDLSYLHLTRLSHALERWTDVTSIDLSHNELHDIGHLGRRIKKLNLRHNRITSGKLAKMPQHVQALNLQHNDITYLPLELTRLEQLRSLELSHNEIDCTCETLEVRNWLLSRNVEMENPVICSSPSQVKGQPWLRVQQAAICDREKNVWASEEDENELMMGDQPVEGSGDVDEEEELGKAFMPIGTTIGPKSSEMRVSDVEGSGDLSEMNMQIVTQQPNEDLNSILATTENDEGSGSGYGIYAIPNLFNARENEDKDNVFAEKPLQTSTTEGPPSEIFGNGMGIFDDNENANENEKKVEAEEVPVVPEVDKNVESVPTDSPNGGTVTEGLVKASVRKEPTSDSNATYYLLGVIILIVVGLILFVGIKRCKHSGSGHDVENQRQTELTDMDRKNPGKPLRYNGLEHSPLITDKTKSDLAKPINGAGKKPYDGGDVKDGSGQQQPLLNGNSNENGHGPADSTIPEKAEKVANVGNAPNTLNAPQEQPPHEYYPITPRYPTPKSPRASKYAQYPQNEQNNNNNNNNNINDQYLPSSPKSGRYSPVYSPETGRVKIKLTETPRPKTPMLVTRTKSNAGDIITTPVRMGANTNNLEVPAVHAQTVGGVAPAPTPALAM